MSLALHFGHIGADRYWPPPSSGFKVRNPPGLKQRKETSMFHSGSRKRPAFHVQSVARAIIHGTLARGSAQRATLLVYDFQFLSYRGTRIKDASICFDFLPSAGSPPGSGPSVKKVGPDERYSMMETTQLESLKKTAKLGISAGTVVSPNGEVGVESSVEKTVTFAAEIIGSRPFDEWGNYFQAQWALQENSSQANGIVSRLRTCVLLTRENDNDFDCVPYIRITPNLTTRLVSLGSVRSRDEAIPFDPSYEPYNDLEGGEPIDRWDLGSVDMTKLWDFTFWTSYGTAVKQRL